MPRLLFVISAFLFFNFSLFAQKSISIDFEHLLDGESFSFNKESKNDLNDDFKLERLEYYISNFSIEHDGGQITSLDGFYFLMRPGTESSIVSIDLGSFDFESIEGVRFHFGIDNETNHSDPAQWPGDHALAPKNPSMHWGWASGYRFIALEGKSGANLDQAMEFHCIGDEFYGELSFPVKMEDQNTYKAFVKAEYMHLVDQIVLKNGVIQHGNLGEIKTLASNFMNNVFTSGITSHTVNTEIDSKFTISPNPILDGYVHIQCDLGNVSASVQVTDVLGNKVANYDDIQDQIFIEKQGVYFVSLIGKDGFTLATRKIIVH